MSLKDDNVNDKSYWKLTGDTVIVLFASNMIVPFTTISFRLALSQQNDKSWSY